MLSNSENIFIHIENDSKLKKKKTTAWSRLFLWNTFCCYIFQSCSSKCIRDIRNDSSFLSKVFRIYGKLKYILIKLVNIYFFVIAYISCPCERNCKTRYEVCLRNGLYNISKIQNAFERNVSW